MKDNKRESVETTTQNTQTGEDRVRPISKDIELDRNVLAIPKKRKAWNIGLKTGNNRSPEKEKQRIETRRKNGWLKDPESTKRKMRNSSVFPKYYETHDVWNKGLTKADPRVANNIRNFAGILKDKEKYKEPIERIRQWNINHPNRKFEGTDIEILFRDALIFKGLKEGIDFVGQIPVRNKDNKSFCRDDWYIISKDLHIFCDGCFCHGCDECKLAGRDGMRERDIRVNGKLDANSIKYFRFKGHDIFSRIDWCIEKLGI